MSLKKFDELTETKRAQVLKMYAEHANLEQFLYDFDDKGGYHGRQRIPAEKVMLPKPEVKPATFEDVSAYVDTPKPRTRRTKTK